MDRSITTINADVAQAEFGARGRGIVWAILATGIDASHPHFGRHQNLSLPEGLAHWDFSTLKTGPDSRRLRNDHASATELGERLAVAADANGYGTSVAAVIAGESNASGRLLRGMAPECKLLSIDVIGQESRGSELNVLAALRAIQAINAESGRLRIHGVTVPLEIESDVVNYACGYSPVCVEVDRLVNSGVVVVAAAGNRGFDDDKRRSVEASITDPGNAPHAITVGSTHRFLPVEYGPSYFSARGPTADGRMKPDLLAPGERITTCFTGELAGSEEHGVGIRDGTAFAAAHVSGAVAAILSVRPELIGRPKEVKDLLLRTAVDLQRERAYQGAGLVDVVAALRAAREQAPPEGERLRPRALRVFCSYAHEDRSLWLEFKTHLSSMERTGLIELWSDLVISPGTEFEPQILEELERADVVLLFVSSYFIDSDYCYSIEMARALQRHRDGRVRVVPVLARPVVVAGTPIAELQMLPPEARAVSTFRDPHEGWAAVAEKLREVVMELRQGRSG